MQSVLKRSLMLMSVLGLIGTTSLLTSFNATPGQAQEAKGNRYLPHLADLMNEAMQVRHTKLWFAGHAENWALAAFEVTKIKETIEEIKENIADIQAVSSQWQLVRVNELLKDLDSNLGALDQAITAKNPSRFETAYQGFTAACNACHIAAGRSQIKIIQPHPNGGGTFADQDFTTGSNPQ